jgi:hypothetical protein
VGGLQTRGKKISLCHSLSPFSWFEQRLELASTLNAYIDKSIQQHKHGCDQILQSDNNEQVIHKI